MITKEKKASIVKEHGGSEKNTGAAETQIALLTERINHITSHLEGQKKDHDTARGLLRLVGQRKKLLSHLQGTNLTSYRQLIVKLGLRK